LSEKTSTKTKLGKKEEGENFLAAVVLVARPLVRTSTCFH
jgi:hypothetical protein